MNLIFNELSLVTKVENKHSARSIMENLLLCCKMIKDSMEPLGLRVNNDFFTAELTDNYTVNSWLSDGSVSQNLKTLLLGLRRSPYIDENDEIIENQFIQNHYFLQAADRQDLHEEEVEGLAVAFLYNTLAISLQTDSFWDQPCIYLQESYEGNEQIVQVKHFNTPARIQDHQEWLDSQRPVELLESALVASAKEINLRDDHGKDVLQTFASRVIHSVHVEKVINSLPFNPHQRNFIKNISPDGKVELVLTWTDQGLGCVVQTTGRNLQETQKIAELIKESYGV